MKTYSHLYESPDALRDFCATNQLCNNDRLLIQVYLGIPQRSAVTQIQNQLLEMFADAAILGSTTDGSIMQGMMVEPGHIVLAFTQFKTTRLKTALVEHSSNHYLATGQKLAEALVGENTRAVISFTDGLSTNGEEFLRGFNQHSPEVVIAGGMAGDNALLEQTLVFTATECTDKGAVGVALDNPELVVHTQYSFNWLPIGKQMQVTKAFQNRVYEIEGQSAYDVYAQYLGSEVARRLPATGIEFPLIPVRKGVTIGRAVIDTLPDGSLVFAGNIAEGEFVRFGVGNVDLILRDSTYNAEQLNHQPVESIFVYSCMGRRHFMGRSIVAELQPLEGVAPTVGFFTYGEFFYAHGETQLLNQTMTQLALSESAEVKHAELRGQIGLTQDEHERSDALQALGYLANAVSRELESLNQDLEARVQEKTDLILRQIYMDSLTMLPNRLKLIHDLDGIAHCYVVLVNIDDFTSVNDFFGHAMGDFVLQSVAEAIREYKGDDPVDLYRLPSDEYAVLHHGYHTRDGIEQWTRGLLEALQHLVIQDEGQSIQVSVTMGIAAVENSTQGLAHADMALKHAKRTRVDYLLYEDNMQLSENVEENLRMATAVRAAVSAGRIVPYYQPIYSVKTREIVKYECLARMITEGGSVVGPAQFLPAAEKIRLYPEVTRLMMEQALACHARTGHALALNITIDDILNSDTREYLLQQLRKQSDVRFLTFEILETQELVEDDTILGFIRDVHALGGEVAIDDFGSGYANFHYMTRIQADVIKIDGSLIRNLPKDVNARAVVETIVLFARKMGMSTVAEFVHSADVLAAVKSIGVDYAQGFYLSEPLSRLDGT